MLACDLRRAPAQRSCLAAVAAYRLHSPRSPQAQHALFIYSICSCTAQVAAALAIGLFEPAGGCGPSRARARAPRALLRTARRSASAAPAAALWTGGGIVHALSFDDPYLAAALGDGSLAVINVDAAMRGGRGGRPPGAPGGGAAPPARQFPGSGRPAYCVELRDQWMASGGGAPPAARVLRIDSLMAYRPSSRAGPCTPGAAAAARHCGLRCRGTRRRETPASLGRMPSACHGTAHAEPSAVQPSRGAPERALDAPSCPADPCAKRPSVPPPAPRRASQPRP